MEKPDWEEAVKPQVSRMLWANLILRDLKTIFERERAENDEISTFLFPFQPQPQPQNSKKL